MTLRFYLTAAISSLVLGVSACHRGSMPSGVPSRTAALPAACLPPSGGPTAAPAISRADLPITDPLVTFDSAWQIIARTHWDTTYNGVDWTALRDELRPQAAAATTTGALRRVLSDMVGRLRQSHFSIIPQEVADAGASGAPVRDRNGSPGFDVRYLDGGIVVSHVDTGGPAAHAGVRAGWLVNAVDGCPTSARLARLPDSPDPRRTALSAYGVAVQTLGGAVGDTRRVQFLDGSNAARDVVLGLVPQPGSIVKFGNLPPMPAHLSYERVQRDGRAIGVIRFNIWMLVLAPQFDAAIDALRDTDAIVLDVRGNFGGVGGMSMGIAGHFFDSARTIGTMHQRGNALKFVANPRRVSTTNQAVSPYGGPLALVVDELSISTTEVFAGGLQALGRARVFGAQTAGQALPAVSERLPNGDILYHAIADFTSPTGQALEGAGVMPQQVTPLTRRALLGGMDPALDAALAWAVTQRRLQP